VAGMVPEKAMELGGDAGELEHARANARVR
jgi:hypothetical protein